MDILSQERLAIIFEKVPQKEKPKKIYFRGKEEILQKRKIAIVGSRKASKYSKTQTYLLSKKLSACGFAVVSGAAEGIDAHAHDGAYPSTVAVMPCGLDIYYPEANRALIQKIYENSVAISEYEPSDMPRNYTFVHRNRLVVGMSEALVITEADEKSGSMRSAEYALKYDIPLYVLSQRVDESMGTNRLLREGVAKPIFDLDGFVGSLGGEINLGGDEALDFASTNPSVADFLQRFGDLTYELELDGKISIKNGTVFLA